MSPNSDFLRPGDEAQDAYPILKEAADGNPVAVVNTDGSYQYVGRSLVEFDSNCAILSSSIKVVINKL